MIEEKSSTIKKKVVRKKLEDLEFWDNFIFTRTMLDKEISLNVASAFLECDIDDLEYLETEKTLDVAYDSKSVRLDCLVKSENRIINIEMQVNDKGDLVFRARYYHTILDMDNLSYGEDYITLPENYVIFACKFDPFNKGLVKYHFESYDRNANIYEGNKMHTLYFNTGAINTLEEGRLKEVLKLIAGIPSEDRFATQVQKKINEIKNNVKWQKDYMKYSADLIVEKREGIEIGKTEGIEIGKTEGIEIGKTEGIEIGKNEGIEIGKTEGIEIGKTEGIEIGKTEGKKEEKLNNAKNLLDILDDETIAKRIGLNIEEVNDLRKNQI